MCLLLISFWYVFITFCIAFSISGFLEKMAESDYKNKNFIVYISMCLFFFVTLYSVFYFEKNFPKKISHFCEKE